MENQKICIIGGGITGLITALCLSKLKVNIDLVIDNINQHFKSNRTLAISQNNYEYFNKLNSFNFSKSEFWPCSEMKLYTESENNYSEIFELKKEQKKIFYMTKYSKIMNYLLKNIKKNKFISIKNDRKVFKILNSGLLKSIKFNNYTSKYNLVIICTGKNPNIIKNFINDKSFDYSYNEVSATIILKHNAFKNNVARQIFLDDEILALLPISNTKTSIVWSIKKSKMKEYLNKNLIQKKIKLYTKNYLKNVKFVGKMEQKDLNFFIREKYFYSRILLFGDALHVVHPLVGQGFNMVLRDLSVLEKMFKNKLKLGLDIGSSDILSEFSSEVKSRNFVFSLGVDFVKKFFSIKERPFKSLRNKLVTSINKNQIVKNIFFSLANKGLKF